MVHSGGKSLHAIVRVDAQDYTEYRKRVEFLYDFLEKNGLRVDKQNRNPSRLSRMPGVTRNGNRQYLVATNIGRKSWVDWLDYAEGITDELPDMVSLDSFKDKPPKLPDSQDTRYTGPVNTAPTVAANYGMGGNNQPFVVNEGVPVTLKIRSGCDGGGKGPLIQEDKSATLACGNDQTLFQPKVYGICSKDSNAMKSDNPRSGFYEAQTTRTLDGNGGNPSCNQGGMAVVAYGIDRAAFNQGKNAQFDFAVDEEVEPTIVAKGPGAVATRTFSASKASFFTQAEEELANTLVATDYKDPPLINASQEYTVRRLTPAECARLQGFPDWWCEDLGTDNPTEEDLAFWGDVWETHRRVVGSGQKPKNRKQLIKWLQNPHSDAAEYKMWGNGVALPCVYFVLSGIVWTTQLKTE